MKYLIFSMLWVSITITLNIHAMSASVDADLSEIFPVRDAVAMSDAKKVEELLSTQDRTKFKTLQSTAKYLLPLAENTELGIRIKNRYKTNTHARNRLIGGIVSLAGIATSIYTIATFAEAQNSDEIADESPLRFGVTLTANIIMTGTGLYYLINGIIKRNPAIKLADAAKIVNLLKSTSGMLSSVIEKNDETV